MREIEEIVYELKTTLEAKSGSQHPVVKIALSYAAFDMLMSDLHIRSWEKGLSLSDSSSLRAGNVRLFGIEIVARPND